MTVKDWVQQWDGRGIDEDGAYGNQCWDLAAKFAKELIGCPRLPTRPGGNGGAKDVFDYFMAPLPQYFDRVVNDPANVNQVPQAGDLIVWGAPMGTLYENGQAIAYGHIAVVLSAKPGEPTLKVFEQVASVGSATTATRNYRYVLGWLSPKVRPAFDAELVPVAPSKPARPPVAMPDGEFYRIQAGDTFWQLEEWWGLPHGTLASFNSSVKPHQLPIGQHIRIRTAPAPVVEAVADKHYRIQAGDTLWDLEEEWGLAHGTLQALNPGIQPRSLRIGQVIRVEADAPAPLAQAVINVAPVREAPVVATPQPAGISITEPAPAPPFAINGGTATKPNWFRTHFAADKVLKDLSALGTFLSAAVVFVVDHHTLIAAVLTALGGVILGENRFKLGKK